MINYITLENANEIHDFVIKRSGGINGFNDHGKGHLDSILCHIQNDDYYVSLIDKLAHLMIGIAMYHVFSDGNKRSAIAIGAAFLLVNNVSDYIVSNFLREMENYIVWLVAHRISEEDFKQKLEYIVYEIDEPIEFKEGILKKISK